MKIIILTFILFIISWKKALVLVMERKVITLRKLIFRDIISERFHKSNQDFNGRKCFKTRFSRLPSWRNYFLRFIPREKLGGRRWFQPRKGSPRRIKTLINICSHFKV